MDKRTKKMKIKNKNKRQQKPAPVPPPTLPPPPFIAPTTVPSTDPPAPIVIDQDCLTHLGTIRQNLYSLIRSTESNEPNVDCASDGNALLAVLKEFSESRKNIKKEPLTLRQQDERIAELKDQINTKNEFYNKLTGKPTVPDEEETLKSQQDHWVYQAVQRALEKRKLEALKKQHAQSERATEGGTASAGGTSANDKGSNMGANSDKPGPSKTKWTPADRAQWAQSQALAAQKANQEIGKQPAASVPKPADTTPSTAPGKAAPQPQKVNPKLVGAAVSLKRAFPADDTTMAEFVDFPLDGQVSMFGELGAEERRMADYQRKRELVIQKLGMYRPPPELVNLASVRETVEEPEKPEERPVSPVPGPSRQNNNHLNKDQINALRTFREDFGDAKTEELPGIIISEEDERIQRFKLNADNVDPTLAGVFKEMDLL